MFEWNETKTIHPHSPYLNYNGFKIYWWFYLIESYFVAAVHLLILYLLLSNSQLKHMVCVIFLADSK